ncbi:MAG: tetratricopeptide repeat protein [Burkholderiales bacterium]
MARTIAILVAVLLASCAIAPEAPRDTRFFDDARFAAASERIDSAQVFALSDDMRRYVDKEITPRVKLRGRQLALVDALLASGELKLEYDSAMTRNASEAFTARAGNCLSLVIMTAAFAKAMEVPLEYQKVFVDDTWARNGNMYLTIGHVNLVLGKWKADDATYAGRLGRKPVESEGLIIDFLPPEDMRAVRSRTITEDIVVAMYMNNRAVEAMARGKIDDAYWFAREAMLQSPGYLVAYNTLGAVYHRHHDLPQAERVLRHVVEREPDNTQALANLVRVLADAGKADESARFAATLARLEPEPPFAFFNRGMAAMRAGDLLAAKKSFERELARSPDYHEFHFWLAVAEVGLGQTDEARKHLAIALKNSTTRKDHDLYAAKLDRLKASESAN